MAVLVPDPFAVRLSIASNQTRLSKESYAACNSMGDWGAQLVQVAAGFTALLHMR